MARVVCVHGIGQQVRGEYSLLNDWYPSLRDGLIRAEAEPVEEAEVAIGFYGDLYRQPGAMLAVDDPHYSAADVQPGLEQQLLAAWWAHAAAADERVAPPQGDTLVGIPRAAQTALLQLCKSRFFAGVALRTMVFDLKQVARYLADDALRRNARQRVAALIGPDTRVVVGHSLGSVVAYETLCALPDHPVRALVTLGSPLGIPNLIFDRLQPAPSGGRGAWPGGTDLVWTNVVDSGDVVALAKDLRPRFGEAVRNAVVHNGAHAHSVRPYLTDKLTGAAIAAGLQ
ncbi:hypothetical protein B0I31_102103 [Saccharothrix carnea]|uniref:Uncharacterized protein n=1 Tax=Saccharothrix carnea TaxID=1280637 RepID=A0A2P8IF80_SACCR|nr:hypothetical protein [Saccharothrix carnea]PSL57126.1 hypothetical protein B0I31_102103 [Saccharothrix carnea]